MAKQSRDNRDKTKTKKITITFVLLDDLPLSSYLAYIEGALDRASLSRYVTKVVLFSDGQHTTVNLERDKGYV